MVNLINLNGLTVLGPGSEWFWSMAQFLIVTVSLVAVYRQLQSQGAANAIQRIESLQAAFTTEEMTYLKLAIARDIQRGELSNAAMAKAAPILDFLSNIDWLHEKGYITIEEVVDNWGRPLEVWAALLEPLVKRQREIEGLAEIYDWKILASVRKEFRRRGTPLLTLNDRERERWLDFIIAQSEARLDRNREVRAALAPTDVRPRPTPSTNRRSHGRSARAAGDAAGA